MLASPSTDSLVRVAAVPGRRPWGAWLAAATVAGVLAVGILHLDHLPFTVCTLKLVTGHPCPTCGTTRALGLLFAGDPRGAFRMNPLATAGVAVVFLWGLADLLLLPWGRVLSVSLSKVPARMARWAFLALVLANWVYLVAAGR